MPDALRVTLEIGPKGKQVVAVAPDWPGLERGAKTGEAALARLRAYLPRYAPVASLAGMGAAFPTSAAEVEVVEQYVGTGSTDFWGISFAFSEFDHQPMSRAALDRDLALLQACWAFFDAVRSRVSAELRKGPRGGGRDRDLIVRHVLANEGVQFAVKVGVSASIDSLLTDEGLRAFREAYLTAMRAYQAEGKPARTWPLRYLIRHTAYHALDHTWEMEDRDLTGDQA
jgi:hypothetical protein